MVPAMVCEDDDYDDGTTNFLLLLLLYFSLLLEKGPVLAFCLLGAIFLFHALDAAVCKAFP